MSGPFGPTGTLGYLIDPLYTYLVAYLTQRSSQPNQIEPNQVKDPHTPLDKRSNRPNLEQTMNMRESQCPIQ